MAIIPVGVNPSEFYDRFSIYERDEIQRGAKLFDGVKDLLSDLKKQGHELYICSTGSNDYINLVLEKTEIKEYHPLQTSDVVIDNEDYLYPYIVQGM